MYRVFLLLSLVLSGCKNLDLLTLYDVEVENTEGIDGFTSTEIFTTGGGDEVWGMRGKDVFCNPFSFSAYDASIDYSIVKKANKKDVSEEIPVEVDRKYNLPTVKVRDRKRVPKNSIHLKTDKNPACEWIGMGIGWDGWQGKDMSRIMERSAIEFVARTGKGYITSLPIVFILEDYSENQCYATANYLGIEGGRIDGSWTKVVVPLQTFSYLKNKIDLTNVKQLLLQCYDATDVYLDNIKIVRYEHRYKRLEDNLTVYDSIGPINIFQDDLVGSWGVDIKDCLNFRTKKEQHRNTYIDIKTDSSSCDWLDFGISWNKWLYTDISRNIKKLNLEFDLKANKAESFIISFEDYTGKKLSYQLNKNDIKQDNKWGRVQIPLYHFPIRKSNVDLTKIKQIHFAFNYNTEMSIDNIKLTKN
tara:strand:+ start:1014 stop:2261 length:1248 start_codon:yes stop_codon:yes gene_type:complete